MKKVIKVVYDFDYLLQKGEFDETKHPRSHGRFAPKGEGGGAPGGGGKESTHPGADDPNDEKVDMSGFKLPWQRGKKPAYPGSDDPNDEKVDRGGFKLPWQRGDKSKSPTIKPAASSAPADKTVTPVTESSAPHERKTTKSY